MIRLEKRKEPSKLAQYLNPFLAVALTMVAGGLMFAALGKDPVAAIRLIFWDPIFSETFGSYSRPQLLIKSAPLILIAVGLSIGFRAGVWNIGAEGQYIIGALVRCGVALAFFPHAGLVHLSADGGWQGALGGFLVGDDPCDPENPLQHERNPCLPAAGLCGRKDPGRDGLGLHAQPVGCRLSRFARPAPVRAPRITPRSFAGHGHPLGRCRGADCGDLCLCADDAPHPGLSHPACRSGAARSAVCGRFTRAADQ
jgi:hypothetical protein